MAIGYQIPFCQHHDQAPPLAQDQIGQGQILFLERVFGVHEQ